MRFFPFPKLSRWHLTAFAVALALLHMLLALSASLTKSPTFDEPTHLTAGYSYWLRHDFRLDPENGNLPQRWSALPLLITQPEFPLLDGDGWKIGSELLTSQSFFYQAGNDSDWMLLQGRAFMAVFGAGLCLLIYFIGQRLFGSFAGLVAEALAVFSPTMLAHSALITSDMCAALFILASVWTVWRATFHLTWVSLLAAIVTTSAALLAKASGPLIVPIFGILLAVRVFDRKELRLFASRASVVARTRKLFYLLALLLVIGACAVTAIWVSFGFRFSPAPPGDAMNERHERAWQYASEHRDFATNVLTFARNRRFLPDAYLFGMVYVYKTSVGRPAFLDGEWSRLGMQSFFPKSFLYKTTVPILLLFVGGIFHFLWGRFGQGEARERIVHNLQDWMPLASLGLVYGFAAMHSTLNIGERHLLPLYPVVFLVAASCVPFLTRHRLGSMILLVLLGWHGAESFDARPDYLAYFNPIAGGSEAGFRHLIDSSLDWGQDLPALRDWLRHNVKPGEAAYLSYFGVGDPKWYRIDASILPGIPYAGEGLNALPQRGFYCVSATILQQAYGKTQGPWCTQYEVEYRRAMGRLNDAQKITDSVERSTAVLKAKLAFEQLMVGRLCAALRQREPIAEAGHSILIYHLTDADVATAIVGSPAELFPTIQVRGHL